MTISPVNRLTTTPEHPPGQGGFVPLLVSRSTKRFENGSHLSAAQTRDSGRKTRPQMARQTLPEEKAKNRAHPLCCASP
jgi:hypothetical protein